MHPTQNPAKLRIHIGHHFFGSGNAGDDLMLAGFLYGVRQELWTLQLTCCSPFDLHSQRLRFPEVQWHSNDHESRKTCIQKCDVWLGLGGSPFQTILSDWMLQHLAQELLFCEENSKPLFFLGVGLNDLSALTHPLTELLCRKAVRMWVRDEMTQEALLTVCPSANIQAGGDLAHLYLQQEILSVESKRFRTETETESKTKATAKAESKAGIVVNFEEEHDTTRRALPLLIEALGGPLKCRWIAQETRRLPGSELDHYELLPSHYRAQLTVAVPSYSSDSLQELLRPFENLNFLATSRYHAALVGAWSGARILVLERNIKLSGASTTWA